MRPNPRRPALQDVGERRQQHQRQHHRDVLDDQPADGDAAALGLDQAALLQGAQQHDGATRPTARGRTPGRRRATSRAPRRAPCRAASRSRSGRPRRESRCARTDSRSFEREMQADAEHQQDDADLGELVGDVLVGDVAGRERARSARRPADSRPAARRAAGAPARRGTNASTRPTTIVAISGV